MNLHPNVIHLLLIVSKPRGERRKKKKGKQGRKSGRPVFFSPSFCERRKKEKKVRFGKKGEKTQKEERDRGIERIVLGIAGRQPTGLHQKRGGKEGEKKKKSDRADLNIQVADRLEGEKGKDPKGGRQREGHLAFPTLAQRAHRPPSQRKKKKKREERKAMPKKETGRRRCRTFLPNSSQS